MIREAALIVASFKDPYWVVITKKITITYFLQESIVITLVLLLE